MTILVVGATGEVGFAVVRHLRAGGHPVRAVVRAASDASALERLGAQVVRADLTDVGSLATTCHDVDVVVCTASAIVPRRGERADFAAIEAGYRALGRLALQAGVARFIFLTVPWQYVGRGAIEFDAKARIESDLRAADVPLTAVRASLFMESWLPAVGSRLAIRDGARHTVDRGFWLTRLLSRTTQTSIDRWGIALVPGAGHTRHSFICADDVAQALAELARTSSRPAAEVTLGGPQPLSWRDVVGAHARVLGRPIRTIGLPSLPFRLLASSSRHLSDAATHLFAVQALVATEGSPYEVGDAERLLARTPRSVEEFLAHQARAHL